MGVMRGANSGRVEQAACTGQCVQQMCVREAMAAPGCALQSQGGRGVCTDLKGTRQDWNPGQGA
jgi:hypothetical protein